MDLKTGQKLMKVIGLVIFLLAISAVLFYKFSFFGDMKMGDGNKKNDIQTSTLLKDKSNEGSSVPRIEKTIMGEIFSVKENLLTLSLVGEKGEGMVIKLDSGTKVYKERQENVAEADPEKERVSASELKDGQKIVVVAEIMVEHGEVNYLAKRIRISYSGGKLRK